MSDSTSIARALFGIIASTLAGTFVVAALVMGATGLWAFLGVAALGVVIAVPVSLMVGKALNS